MTWQFNNNLQIMIADLKVGSPPVAVPGLHVHVPGRLVVAEGLLVHLPGLLLLLHLGDVEYSINFHCKPETIIGQLTLFSLPSNYLDITWI